MLFQPVLPIPLTENWKILTRPVIPVVFGASVSNPVLTSAGAPKLAWDTKSGLGDIVLPLLFNPTPKGGLSLGAGPTFSFPTATHTRLGSEKWSIGPAAVGVFKTKKITAGALVQHWFSVAGDDGRKDVNQGSILYFFWYMLPGAWQIGMSPSISYDLMADPGNKLNLPIGLTIGKTVKVGSVPTKFRFGFDYSLVRQDNLGQSWKIKLAITPVIPGVTPRPRRSAPRADDHREGGGVRHGATRIHHAQQAEDAGLVEIVLAEPGLQLLRRDEDRRAGLGIPADRKRLEGNASTL